MAQKKEDLQKLFKLVSQVANEPGNEWFKQELISNFGSNLEIVLNQTESSIKKIYEHCIKEIIEKQAQNFYKDFKLTDIKDKLVSDFIRMEHFRREDNFEDFSLALHQQIENIINQLAEKNIEFREKTINNKDKEAYRFNNKPFKLCHLILSDKAEQKKIDEVFLKDIFQWEYNQKLKSVLYYFAFEQKIIYNYNDFKTLNDIGNDIYQARNLNHRGGLLTDKQTQILKRIDTSKDKYYFKFLGFLETLVTKINAKL